MKANTQVSHAQDATANQTVSAAAQALSGSQLLKSDARVMFRKTQYCKFLKRMEDW